METRSMETQEDVQGKYLLNLALPQAAGGGTAAKKRCALQNRVEAALAQAVKGVTSDPLTKKQQTRRVTQSHKYWHAKNKPQVASDLDRSVRRLTVLRIERMVFFYP